MLTRAENMLLNPYALKKSYPRLQMQEEILRARQCLLTASDKSSVGSVLKLLEQTYKKLRDEDEASLKPDSNNRGNAPISTGPPDVNHVSVPCSYIPSLSHTYTARYSRQLFHTRITAFVLRLMGRVYSECIHSNCAEFHTRSVNVKYEIMS